MLVRSESVWKLRVVHNKFGRNLEEFPALPRRRVKECMTAKACCHFLELSVYMQEACFGSMGVAKSSRLLQRSWCALKMALVGGVQGDGVAAEIKCVPLCVY